MLAGPAITRQHLGEWHEGVGSVQVQEKFELFLPQLVWALSTRDLAQQETVHIELIEPSPHLVSDDRLRWK